MSAHEVKHAPVPADTQHESPLLHVWKGYEWTDLVPPLGTLSYCGRRRESTSTFVAYEGSTNDCIVCIDLAPEWEWGAI